MIHDPIMAMEEIYNSGHRHLPKFALSIRQPWAYAIVSNRKTIENRDWSTNFRGEICIHAAKTLIKRDFYDDRKFIIETQDPKIWGNEFLDLDEMQKFGCFGAIIGTANIVDCISESESPWFFGKYGFVLENIKTIEPIQCKGALGFFDWRKINGAS